MTPLPPPFAPPTPPAGALTPPGLPPGVNGIPGASGTPPPPPAGPVDPAQIKYVTETQANGTVLIRLVGAGGIPGPVVHIWEPPAVRQAGKK